VTNFGITININIINY